MKKGLKITQLIKQLEKLKEENGDVLCAMADLCMIKDAVFDKFNRVVVITDIKQRKKQI